jgi:hypothetical protein
VGSSTHSLNLICFQLPRIENFHLLLPFSNILFRCKSCLKSCYIVRRNSVTIKALRAQPLSQQQCEVCALADGAAFACVSNKTATTLEAYSNECTTLCGVPYAFAILWTCSILPQLATLLFFCPSTLEQNGLVHNSILSCTSQESG